MTPPGPLSHARLLALALCADAGRLWDALLQLPLLGEDDRRALDYALTCRNSATLLVAELARRAGRGTEEEEK